MQIIRMLTGALRVNTYIVFREGFEECLVVDPGDSLEKISAKICEKGLRPVAVLLTHGHFDHTGSAASLQNQGAKIYCHELDEEMLRSEERSLAGMFGLSLHPCKADVLLKGGEVLSAAGLEIRVIATPGHSEGGVCYLIEGELFSGDTLFCEGVGRTNFPGGDGKKLLDSIREKLFSLRGDCPVHPGHGEETNLNYEREHNPFVHGGDLYDF